MANKISQETKKSPKNNASAKKAAVLETKKRNPWPVLAVLVCAGLALLAGLLFFNKTGEKPGEQPGEKPPVMASADMITHPLEIFEDGKARFFQFQTNEGITVKYFVLKSSDGVMRAAFDACDVCWRAGKGYYQEDDFMVCRNCGRRFASVKVNEVKGGCNPAPLERDIVGNKLVIRVKDILEGKPYFNFASRS
jgi:uncharacterized membrane protein